MQLGHRIVNILVSVLGCFLAAVAVVHAADDRPDAATIVRRLESNQEAVRKSAVSLVEWNQGHDADYLAAIDNLLSASLRRPALESHFRALEKLTDCPAPDGSKIVAKSLGAFDWRLSMTAVEVLGRRQADSQAKEIAKVWFRPDAQKYYALRHAVVCTLGDIGKSQSTAALVELLPALEGQLKYEAIARLTLRTGQNHGDDLTAWKDWWSGQDGVLPNVAIEPDTPLPENIPWAYPVPKFFARPIYSQKVVFVLDHSGSMNSTLNGQTRLAAMQEQFQQAIQRLPESASFSLIVFNQQVDVWRTPLVPANTVNKTAAIQSIYSLQANGLTAIYDSLERGLQLDQNIEQIIFLTDGRPTAGKYTRNEDIIQNIAQLNRYLHTRIDCLGIDTEGPPEELLKEISRQTYGTYVRIR